MITQNYSQAERILRSIIPDYEYYQEMLKSIDAIGQDYLAHYNTESAFNSEGFSELGNIGLFYMCASKNYNGCEFPFLCFVVALERLAEYEPGSALGYAIHDTTSKVVAYDLTGEKERHYIDMIKGRSVAAFALTEEGSGSDARNSVRAMYKRCGDGFELRGKKQLITNGYSADLIVLVARDADNPDRLSAFLAEANKGGLKKEIMKDKNSVRTSETTLLEFDGYIAPLWSLIGREGEGFDYFLGALDSGRITIACISNGISNFAMQRTVDYASNREAFGRKLIDLPAYRARIDAMQEALDSSRKLTYQAALLCKDSQDRLDKDYRGPAAVAKFAASETASTITNECIEMCGGTGIFDKELNYARQNVDICRIGEGANGLLAAKVIPQFADNKWVGYLKRQEALNRRMKPNVNLLSQNNG